MKFLGCQSVGFLLLVAVSVGDAPHAQADILRLRDGSRHYGRVLSTTADAVRFEVALDERTRMVREFSRAEIREIIRNDQWYPPKSAREDAVRAERRRGAPEAALDFEQVLREAYELIDDSDDEAALRALQFLVQHASVDVLAELSVACRAARGVSLPRLLASQRLRVALSAESRVFRLRFVTRYEARELGMLLSDLQQRLLQKSHDGKRVSAWAADADYHELGDDAHQLVADAQLAAAVLEMRLRHDPALTERATRRAVELQRQDLGRLAAHVAGMSGYTDLGAKFAADDPTLDALRRLRELSTTPATRPAPRPLTEDPWLRNAPEARERDSR